MERAFMLLVAGEVARARGSVSDSTRAMLREAAVLDSSAEVLSSLASISAAAGDVRGAIETERRLQANQSNVGYEAQFEWSLARYRLGQLHERLGENAEARKQYEAFLSEWADAEPTLPVLVDTRARLKRLLALQPKRES
jgi:tetratricopeptide (TPR) repeat protein